MEKSVEIEQCSDSNLIIVAFAGVGGDFDVPLFQFVNVLSAVKATKVFVRDLDQCYYQAGLQDISTDVDSTAEYLSELIKDKYSIFVGHSMGGFAALLFGSLCRADKIVAFAPQLFIDEHNTEKYNTLRWKRYSRLGRELNGNYQNVIPLIPIHAEIYYPKKEAEDSKYVKALQDAGIEPILTEYTVHHIAKKLKEDGKLLKVIVPEEFRAVK